MLVWMFKITDYLTLIKAQAPDDTWEKMLGNCKEIQTSQVQAHTKAKLKLYCGLCGGRSVLVLTDELKSTQ